jgi:predicted secreted Zn-dependent protease
MVVDRIVATCDRFTTAGHAQYHLRMRMVGLGLVVLMTATSGCAGGHLSAAERAQLPRSTDPEIEVRVTRKDETYSVRGRTAEELCRGMRLYGAKEWDSPDTAGRTMVNLTAQLQCREYSNGGAIERGVVHLDLIVTLPLWEDRSSGSPELRQHWDELLSALAAHEEGHVEIAKEHADMARSAFAWLKPEPSCQPMSAKVRELSEHLGKKVLDAENQFDIDTKHGLLAVPEL